jgi:hypothetical protein
MLRHLMMERSEEVAQREWASGKGTANRGETRRKAYYARTCWIVRVAIGYEMNPRGQLSDGQRSPVIINDVSGGRIGDDEVEWII